MGERINVGRIAIIVTGVLLAIASAGAVLFLYVLSRPATLEIAVASRDIMRGERVREDNVAFITIYPKPNDPLIDFYITRREIDDYVGRRVLDVVREGGALLKTNFLDRYVETYYQAVTDDPNQVIVLLDVASLVPNFIRAGDHINIFVTFGSSFNASELPRPTLEPTATPTPLPLLLGTVTPTPTAQPAGEQTTNVPEPTPTPTPEATPTPAIIVALPGTMLLLENVPVVNIFRSGTAEDPGPIQQIAVLVPRRFQQLLVLANNARALRFTVSGPSARPVTSTIPLRPLSFFDFAELFRFQFEQSIARGELLTATLYSQYLSHYYPELYQSIRATQVAWTERERGTEDKTLEDAVKENLLP